MCLLCDVNDCDLCVRNFDILCTSHINEWNPPIADQEILYCFYPLIRLDDFADSCKRACQKLLSCSLGPIIMYIMLFPAATESHYWKNLKKIIVRISLVGILAPALENDWLNLKKWYDSQWKRHVHEYFSWSDIWLVLNYYKYCRSILETVVLGLEDSLW